MLAGLACVVLKTIETIGTIFSFLYFSFPSFFFLLFFFLLPLSFIISLFLSLFCVLPKAKQLEDGGGYGGEHAGGKGESEIDTVAIIALKAA